MTDLIYPGNTAKSIFRFSFLEWWWKWDTIWWFHQFFRILFSSIRLLGLFFESYIQTEQRSHSNPIHISLAQDPWIKSFSWWLFCSVLVDLYIKAKFISKSVWNSREIQKYDSVAKEETLTKFEVCWVSGALVILQIVQRTHNEMISFANENIYVCLYFSSC